MIQQISAIKYAIAEMDATERDRFSEDLSVSGTQTGEAMRQLMTVKNVGPITALEVLLAVIEKCSRITSP